MLHSFTADPFKLALYELTGKLEPSRRSISQVTTTTENWLWFQLAMVDENEDGGFRALAEVLLGYGERDFDGLPNQPGLRRGVWAGVPLMYGQLERVGLLLSSLFATNIDLFLYLGSGGALGIPRNRDGGYSSRTCIGVQWTSQSALVR